MRPWFTPLDLAARLFWALAIVNMPYTFFAVQARSPLGNPTAWEMVRETPSFILLWLTPLIFGLALVLSFTRWRRVGVRVAQAACILGWIYYLSIACFTPILLMVGARGWGFLAFSLPLLLLAGATVTTWRMARTQTGAG